MLFSRAAQRGERRREERNSTNKNVTEGTEGRKSTKVTIWQVQSLGFPVRETAFLNVICIITDYYELLTDTGYFLKLTAMLQGMAST